MKRLQVSILAMVLSIVACAMAFVALRTASDLWLSALYTFTTVLLLGAVIAARFRRGNEKAFWFGFAVFGSAFFVVGLGPWPNPAFDEEGNGMGIALNQNLLSFRVIIFLVPYLRTETNEMGAIDKITTNTIGIAHLLTSLAIAIGGGMIAILIRRRRGRLVTGKALATLAGFALLTSVVLSIKSAPPSARYLRGSWFMGEPSLKTLSDRDRDAIVYRLTWLPSFHHPVCVRIDQTGGATKLRLKVLDGKGGYREGQIAIDKSIALGADQVTELHRHLERAAFWRIPTEEKINGIIMDGDTLVVEGVKGGTYHLVVRRDPDLAFTRLCRKMLDLSGLALGTTWVDYHPGDDEPEMVN